MTIKALEANVKYATADYELECLFAGGDESVTEVVAAKAFLVSAQEKLARAKGVAKTEREHAEACRIAAAMAEAPTEVEALEILRCVDDWERDQRADAAVQAGAAEVKYLAA